MKRRDFQDILVHIYAGFVVLVTFGIYVKTLAPTVSFFDSGELIAAAYTLGIAHPPGYPLYVLLGWFFSKLPVGYGAYRLNLMSAFFAALSALMVYYLTYTLIAQFRRNATHSPPDPKQPDPQRMLYPIAALSAALMFAFSITHWRHAVIAEVYALNAFLCGLIILLLITWRHACTEAVPLSGGGFLSDNTPLPPSRWECQAQEHLTSDWNASAPNPPLRGAGGCCPTNNLPLEALPPSQEVKPTPIPSQEGNAGNAQESLPIPAPSQEGNSGKGAPVQRVWLLYLVALLFGLGFGNHQTIALLFFAASFLVLITTPKILLDVKRLFLIVLFLLLGLSIYLLLPIRAASNPPINWGNPQTWRQFKWLVAREGYKNVPRGHALKALWDELLGKQNATATTPAEREADQPASEKPTERAGMYQIIADSLFLKQLRSFHPLQEFGATGLALAVVGLLYLLVCQRVIGITLVIAVLSMVIITVIIGDPPEENIFLVEEFHTPSYLIIAVWIGVGALAVARYILWVVGKRSRLQYGLVFLIAMSYLILPGIQMRANLQTVDRRRNYVAYDYAANVLKSLQPHAILFTWGDSGAFPLWYLQVVEHQRPDVLLIHVPHLSSDWFVASLPPDLFFSSDPYRIYRGKVGDILNDIIHKQFYVRPMYFDYSSSHSIIIPYELIPNGITYKVALPQDQLDENIWNQYSFRGILDNTRIALDPDIERTFLMYGAAHVELGNYYMQLNELEKAADQFNIAVRFAPELGPGIVESLHFQDKMIGTRE